MKNQQCHSQRPAVPGTGAFLGQEAYAWSLSFVSLSLLQPQKYHRILFGNELSSRGSQHTPR
jgi:hypothetical protein